MDHQFHQISHHDFCYIPEEQGSMNTNPDDTMLHILVVEDNRTQAEYLRHLLEKRGHQVTVTSNGFEALEMISMNMPDIILTDVMMPDMDGYTLCKRLKQEKLTSDIPVILVTHLYSPVDVIKGLEAGADNFIIKPFDPEYIFSRIGSIMQAKDHCQTEEPVKPLDVIFSSEVHTISSSRMQILNILLSTYETAVKNNSELQVAHERLHYTNAQLQKVVEDLQQTNESLHVKNLERGRLEASLVAAQKKIADVLEVIQQVQATQVQAAYQSLCDTTPDNQQKQKKSENRQICSLINNCMKTLDNTRQYLEGEEESRTWMSVRELITNSIAPIRLQTIRYENLIPEDVEIFTGPGFRNTLSCIISSLQNQNRIPGEIRFSFHLKEDGYSIIIEDNGPGIQNEDKERIFSRDEALNIMPELTLIREILAVSGFQIRERGVPGQGAKCEITCSEEAIRFSSDLLNLSP